MSKSKIKIDRVTVEYGNNVKRSWFGLRKTQPSPCEVGGRVVLKDISLEIQHGEFVSILGHSGCGKSTLLKIIAGFSTPSTGKVWIDGEEVVGPRPDHVFVFQEGALFPWLTIGENVAMALRSVKDARERQSKAQEYLALVALEGVENYYPYMLSGGMKQRAEIARALAAQPDILLMDEPFSGLDHLTRLHLREEMLYLHIMLKDTTILFVTHDIDEALQLSNRLIILSEPPAQVKCVRSIKVPHPRNLASEDLSDLRANIYHHLGVHTAI
ncbi:ABC transporter ATP-binding protein [Syntrophobacter fumaroxidans]|uniref:ABC transporter related n=1 Tax=Syntrophobacter fumaroxidans (strain DSM 10017 / MPOB) TaxID=335543 RepID=A0LIS8_SYNFM|nr:ABC transporter ATP-binding protein [Syntrophobacter fumaroxidans]ABK17330.1 ABC transporter related [Syntrophobacter fumaroxidans MPOB]HOI93681.1 ABC transporter ATP-binding protein [Syntrophobacter fumaroxidans]